MVLFKIQVTEFILNLFMGESAIIITKGQEVIPKKLTDTKYFFQFPDIVSTLDNLINKSGESVESI
jgi:NAD dependent epimerase/dehydratase family enzyme